MEPSEREICGNCGEPSDACIGACPGLAAYEAALIDKPPGEGGICTACGAGRLFVMTPEPPAPPKGDEFRRLVEELQRLQEPGVVQVIPCETKVVAPGLGLAEYQRRAATTAVYPGRGDDQLLYPLLGLASEVGEVADKLYAAAHAACGDDSVALATLGLVIATGKIASALHKAYRDRGGVVEEGRRYAARAELATIEDHAHWLRAILDDEGVRADLPPLREADDGGLAGEIGGCLWYLAALCGEAGIQLASVASQNLETLAGRQARGVLGGDGDNR